MKAKELIIIIFVFFPSFLFCQNIDSLRIELNKSKQDSTKIQLQIEIGYYYEYEAPDSSVYYYSKAIKLADLCLNKTKKQFNKKTLFLKSTALMNISGVYKEMANYNEAITCINNSLSIFTKLNEKKEIAECYTVIGSIYKDQGIYDKAVDSYLKSIRIFEEIEYKKGISRAYNNIGIIHSFQKNYDKAVEYFNYSFKIYEATGNKHGMSQSYINIGNIYYLNAEELISNNPTSDSAAVLFNNAKLNFKKAFIIKESNSDKKGMSMCYNNIGNVYKELALIKIFKNNSSENITLTLDSAIYNLKNALILFEENGDKYGIATVTNNIASAYISLADFCVKNKNFVTQKLNLTKAIEIGLKSYNIALEIGAFSLQKDATQTLKVAFTSLGNYKEALKYADLYNSTKDNLFSEEKTTALVEAEKKFETEKKQLQIEKLEKQKELDKETIARQNAEKKKQLIVIYSFILGFITILIFSIIIYRLFLQKKKANFILAQQKEEIEAQRDEIETQRDLVTQQKEHIEKIHQEMTDSINYAKRIQEAVLPVSLESRAILGEHFILFRPKDIVSGDFYWTAKVENTLVVAVADCTGHGVPGAFMSMLGISFLNEIVRKKEITKANEVLNELRKEIINALQQKGQLGEQKDGMDMSLAVISQQSKSSERLESSELYHAQWAGANNPLWLIRSQQSSIDNLIEFKPDKMPIAIYERMDDFTNHEIQLNSGDLLYLMSDGYEDQFGGPKIKKFLSKNLKQLLFSNCQLPMEEQKLILEKTLIEWIGEGEQIDDITILGIKI